MESLCKSNMWSRIVSRTVSFLCVFVEQCGIALSVEHVESQRKSNSEEFFMCVSGTVWDRVVSRTCGVAS